MQQRHFRSLGPILVFIGICGLIACSSKKMAKVVQPAAPPPLAPVASLSAKPDVIQQGQSTVLSWQTANAADITLEGVGSVGSSGSRSVSPTASRTYTLIAKGAGGTSQAVARVTVNPVTAAAAAQPSDSELFMKNMRDVFFNFDDSHIRQDQAPTTEKDAGFLSQHANLKISIEGHCDDRGSEMYNLALGERRASAVKEALIRQGIDPSRIATISYGKEKPFCTQEDETCWQENRRDHIVPKQ
jgi:peptidoglycan-associated lipoprotein